MTALADRPASADPFAVFGRRGLAGVRHGGPFDGAIDSELRDALRLRGGACNQASIIIARELRIAMPSRTVEREASSIDTGLRAAMAGAAEALADGRERPMADRATALDSDLIQLGHRLTELAERLAAEPDNLTDPRFGAKAIGEQGRRLTVLGETHGPDGAYIAMESRQLSARFDTWVAARRATEAQLAPPPVAAA